MPESSQVPVIDNTANVHPAAKHAAHMSQLAEKIAGSKFTLTGIANVNDPRQTQSADPIESPADMQVVETVAPETPEATTEPTPEAPKPAEQKPSDRLAKSVEIQRRADQAAKRAKEISRRAAEDKRIAEQRSREAEEHSRQVAKDRKEIDGIKSKYQDNLDLLANNPLEFMRQHGIDGNGVAEFVREGADPTKRQLQNMQRQMKDFADGLRQEYNQAIQQVQSKFVERDQAEARRNFFDFVDSAQTEAPETYPAMGLVFNNDELWTKANEVAERLDKLQPGAQPDRLLEEIENEAKKDPRWSRIQARFQPKPTTPNSPKSNATAKASPNQEDKSVQEVRPDRKPREVAQPGNSRPMTPLERHKAHVARVAEGVRFK